jgi:hypothetical protein
VKKGDLSPLAEQQRIDYPFKKSIRERHDAKHGFEPCDSKTGEIGEVKFVGDK